MCPFCGKTYKRLKSHLPHCKAASPGHEAAGGSAQHQLGHKSSPQNLTGPQSKQSRPASAARSQTAASASPPSAGPASVPKKQKVSEQIKAALVPPPSVSLTSGPKPPRASTSKAKQRTGQGLLAPAKGSRSAPEGPSPAQHVTKPGSGSGTDASRPASQPRNGGSSKTRVSERQATPAASVIQNFRTQENIAKPRGRKTDLATTEREIDDLSVNKGSGSGPPSKMILQDAKALLGRDRKSLKPSRPSLLVPVHSSGPSTASSSLSQAPPATGTPDDQLVGTSSAPASQPALGPAHLSPQVHRALKSLSTASPPLGHFSSTNLPPAAVEALGAPQGPVTDNSRTEG